KPAFTGIVRLEEGFLERSCEELLSEILGVFVAGRPFHTDVLVDRLPINSNQFIERLLAYIGIFTLCGKHNGVPRRRKRVTRSADSSIRIHGAGIIRHR